MSIPRGIFSSSKNKILIFWLNDSSDRKNKNLLASWKCHRGLKNVIKIWNSQYSKMGILWYAKSLFSSKKTSSHVKTFKVPHISSENRTIALVMTSRNDQISNRHNFFPNEQEVWTKKTKFKKLNNQVKNNNKPEVLFFNFSGNWIF